jgi:hypothetical protein
VREKKEVAGGTEAGKLKEDALPDDTRTKARMKG